MTVTSTTSSNQYTGTGTTGPFTYSFRITDATQLAVTLTTTAGATRTLAYPSEYSVSGVGLATGSITTTAAVDSGVIVTIIRTPALTQTTSLRNQGAYYPAVVEDALDYLMFAIQYVYSLVTTAIRLPSTVISGAFSGIMPVTPASGYLRINAAGTAYEAVTNVNDPGTWTQSGTGAVSRTVTAKFGEAISVKDFGAVGNGVTDDSVAVQACITAVPNGSTILFPSGGNYKLSSVTPTLSSRSDLTFIAYGATMTLSGSNRSALLFASGTTNTRIKWYGGNIVGSGVLADNHQGIGTAVSPSSGTVTTDLLVSDVSITQVVRGVYVDVSSLGDATNITYRRVNVQTTVGTSSGQGYGLVMSGVWGGTIDDCWLNAITRHAIYVSVSKRVQLANLRVTNHTGPYAYVIARNSDINGVNLTCDSSQGVGMSIEPHDTNTGADTGRHIFRNLTFTNTASGVSDVYIGSGGPSTSSVLYDVLVDGVTINRPSTETASGSESIRIRNGKNIVVRNILWQSTAALTVTKTVVYVAADGGAAYTDTVTVEGVRGRALALAGGGFLAGVEVATAICTGTMRVTLRNNEAMASGGSGGVGILYDAGVTNTQIEARFNRARGALTGTAVLVGGTVTVASTEVLAGDKVSVSRTTTGGTPGHLSVGTITAGTSFVLNSSSGADTSTVLWEIVH